jgi:hypothetical protein
VTHQPRIALTAIAASTKIVILPNIGRTCFSLSKKPGCPILRSPIAKGGTNNPFKFLTLILLLALSTPADPQGCTQCRDNTVATPPKTQAAYRHAIELLVITAGGLFLGTLIILKKQR